MSATGHEEVQTKGQSSAASLLFMRRRPADLPSGKQVSIVLSRPLMQQRRHPTYASVKVSADFPLFGHPPHLIAECSKVFLPDKEGRGQSRRGLRPSPPNCKAVEGVRPEATVSLARIPSLRSQESSQRVSDNSYNVINQRIFRAKVM